MNLQEIDWPVFRLSDRPPIVEGDVIYFRSEYADRDDASLSSRVRLVDNKSIQKSTLGRRRLELQAHGVPLYHIGRAVYFLSDLLKIAKATTWFIDSSGNLFQFKKTKRVLLTCKKITQVLPGQVTGSVIEVEGLAQRFKSMYAPKPEQTYAGFLKLGVGYIFYGFYSEPFKDSWRKV